MAAEPIGSAYVIIRAITSQLSKDIKDGLDKGAKDADVDESGRELGGRLGESTGEGFEESWTERSSEAIRDSADSRDMRRATRHFSDTVNERIGDRLGGREFTSNFGERMRESIQRGLGDIDVDRATGDIGDDIGVAMADNTRTSFSRESEHIIDNEENRDTFRRGGSRVATEAVEGMAEGVASGAGRVGTSAAASFADSFIKAMSSLSVPGGAAVVIGTQLALPFLGAAAQTVGALGGVIVSVLGFIGTAAAGAGVALLGLGAAIAPAFFGIKAALSAPSEALDLLTERAEVFKEDWQAFGRSVQAGLFDDLILAMDTLTVELLPIFTSYGEALGTALGDGVTGIVDEIVANKGLIEEILTDGIPVVTTLSETFAILIAPILTILAAAMPIAQQLADDLKAAAQRFADFINAEGQEGLTDRFQVWYDRLSLLVGILFNFGAGLLNIFGLGADSATPFFDSLSQAAEDFRAWTSSAEGQNKIQTFFENAWEIGNEVFGLLGDIIELIAGPLLGGGAETREVMGISVPSVEDDQVTSITNFFKSIREEWLPLLVEWGKVAQDALEGPVGDFFTALADFFRTLADNPEIVEGIFSILLTNFFIFTEALELLSSILKTDIAKEFGPLILRMLFFMKVASTFMKLGKSFAKFLKPFGKLFALIFPKMGAALKGVVAAFKSGGLIAGFKALGAAIKGFGVALLANPVVLLIAAIVAAVTLLYFHFKPFRDFVDKYIIDPIQRLWEKIGGLQGIIAFFKDVGEAIMNFFRGVKEAFDEGGFGGVIDFLVEQLGKLGTLILDGLKKALPEIGRFIGDLAGKIVTWFDDHKDEIGEIGLNILQWIGERLLDLAGLIGDLVVAFGQFLLDHADEIGQFGLDMLGWIGEKLLDLGGLLFEWLAAFGGWLAEHAPGALLTLGENLLGWIFDGLVIVGGKLFEWLGALGGWLAEHAPGALLALGKNLLGWIFDGLKSLVDLGGLLFEWLGAFGGWLAENAPDALLALGKNLLGWIFDGLKSLVEIGLLFGEWIAALGLWLATNAPTLFLEMGKDLLGFIFNGIKNVVEIGRLLGEWIAALGMWLITSGPGLLIDLGKTILGLVFTGLGNAGELAIQFARWIGELVEWVITKGPAALAEFIKAFGQAIWDGIRDFFVDNPLTRAVTGAVTIESGTLDFEGLTEELERGLQHAIDTMQMTGTPDMQPLFALLFEQFGDAGTQMALAIETAMQDGLSDIERQNILDELAHLWETGEFVDLPIEAAEATAQSFAGTLDTSLLDAFGDKDWDASAKLLSSGVLDAVTATDTEPDATAFVISLADSIGALDALMIPAANKLVDRLLLTLARLHNETTPKVINPFLLKMVDGINKTADASVKASNRLVDRVLLTLSRIGNETTRTMNPFILRLVESINRARDLAVSAANRLADGVLLTIGRIGNEVSRVLAPVAGRMTTALFAAGLAAANSLLSGFKLGTLALIIYLQGLDEIIRNNVGDLSNVLYQEGRDLMNGLIRGVKSAVGSTTVNVPLTFAHGGIVPGTGAVPAIVHGGELILNAAQQAALGSNVTRWAGVAATALSLAGQSQRWMLDLLTQMKHESGGNPRAVNRWDINWRLGHPSMGLMQVIMPTFLANAGKLVSRGILDPLANVFAAIIYTLRRYGDLGRWRRGGFRGYSEGGIFDRPTLGLFAEAGREALVPLTRPSRALEIMRAAGLDSLVLGSQRDQNRAIDPTVTGVTMLHVDHAEIFDKVDVDIIAARLRSAYTSMGRIR